MKKFFYRVREIESGNLLEGYIKAKNKQEAVLYLKREQYLIIELKNYDVNAFRKSVAQYWQMRKINTEFLVILCRELAILINSGINIIEAFKIIQENTKDKVKISFLNRTLQKLSEGNSLSQIWQKEKFIPAYMISSLIVAEHTGLLAKNLNEVADYLSKIQEEKKKLMQISIYPAFLLMMLIAITSIMLFWVLPTFADIFQKMHVELPLLTRMILSLGNFVKHDYMYLFGALIICLGVAVKLWKQENVRYKILKYVFTSYGIGDFLIKLYLLKISRQLNFLLSSGIGINESLNIIIANLNNIYMEKQMKIVQRNIQAGFSLCKAFKQTGIYNSIFLGLLNVGEQTGMLAENLSYIVNFLEKDIDRFIMLFMKLLEPMLMLAVGMIVGTFVLAIILPLFEIANGIGL